MSLCTHSRGAERSGTQLRVSLASDRGDASHLPLDFICCVTAGVAGLLKRHASGGLDAGQSIVCTLTGNGLKDPQWALEGASDPVVIPVDVAAAARALGLEA